MPWCEKAAKYCIRAINGSIYCYRSGHIAIIEKNVFQLSRSSDSIETINYDDDEIGGTSSNGDHRTKLGMSN